MNAPGWFKQALDAPYSERVIEVAGTPINYLDWGEQGLPGLVLVHGGAAHSRWWSFVAPFFTHRYHVVALDLSGHGNSGRRDRYSHDLWADEILAVADDAGFPGPPVIIGHSLGGLVTIQTAVNHGERLAGAVIVDSPVRRPDPESEEGARGAAFRSPGTYATLDEAMARFRLIPPQPCDNDYIIEHISRHSLHETEAGWTWKFDPHLFTHTMVPLNEQLAAVKIRVALIRGHHSVVVPADTADYMYELMGRVAPVITIPESHHHLFLDQPIAFASAIRTLLADWEHSTPKVKRP
ncbi:MAG: alpha/beta hydrolase [Acidimicrobiia bacterium]|nr:alpha/beta hydrolase [Acidimicrobiia bacterium]